MALSVLFSPQRQARRRIPKETLLSGHKGSLEGHTRAPAARASPIQILRLARRWAAGWIFASPSLLAGAAERLPADVIFRQCAEQLSGFDWRCGPVLRNGSTTAALSTSSGPALQRGSDAETHVYECDDRCRGDAGVRASGVCREAGTEESSGVSRSGSGSD